MSWRRKIVHQCVNRYGWPTFATPSTRHGHFVPTRTTVRHLRTNVNREELKPCEAIELARPKFRSTIIKGGNVDRNGLSVADIRRLREEMEYLSTKYLIRLKTTGLYNGRGKGRYFVSKGQAVSPNNIGWESANTHRLACFMAMTGFWPYTEEVKARKFCAKTKDPRYPVIYHTLDKQANILYLLGRFELEGNSKWRIFAVYILSIAAGLGHLEAALLLHQIEKHDKQFIVQPDLRAVIAKGASLQADWRAMVAQAEYLMSTIEQRAGQGVKTQESILEECLDLLKQAATLTHPASHVPLERESPPVNHIDVDVLEMFDPPYKLLINITGNEIKSGNKSADMIQTFESALLEGALDYNDTDAAWQYAQWQQTQRREEGLTPEGVQCLELAARSANAEACFELAKHHFRSDGWFPSITSTALTYINRKESENRRKFLEDPSAGFIDITEQDKHDLIMARKKPALLKRQEGIYWMKVAAELNLTSPTKVLNRICIVAGLYRQNGFLAEGKEVLQSGRQQLEACVGDVRAKNRAIRILDEYVEHWDSRLVHHLLTPEDIGGLLGLS